MTIYCKLCDFPIRSTQPESLAQSEVMETMTKHLVASHQEQAVSLGADIGELQKLLSTYLLIKHYVRIPPDEDSFRTTFQANEESLLEMFAGNLENQN